MVLKPSADLDVTVVVNKNVFYLGETIQGFLSVVPTTAVTIGIVCMELMCECQSELLEHTFRSLEDNDHSVDLHYFPHAVQLRTAPTVVFEARPTGGAVFAAAATVPFAFPLPSTNMPSSLRLTKGNQHYAGVTYYLDCSTFDISGKLMHTVRNQLYVFASHAYVSAEKPLMGSTEIVTKKVCCIQFNRMTVHCATDKSVYCPGDQVQLRYWIETNKPETLPALSVTARLMMNVKSPEVGKGRKIPKFIIYVPSMPVENRFESPLVTQKLPKPVLGSVTHAVLTLPQGYGPAFVNSGDGVPSTALEWNYDFFVEFVAGTYMPNKVRVSLPIVINGKSAEHLTQDRSAIQVELPRLTTHAQALFAATASISFEAPSAPTVLSTVDVDVDAAVDVAETKQPE